LQAQAGQAAHLLDDLNLLVARGLEDDVKLVLLLGLLGLAACGPACGRGGYRHGGGRLHVERLLELLHEIGELEQGHLLERLEEVVRAHLRHVVCSSFLQIPSARSSCDRRVVRVGSGQPSSPSPGASGVPVSGALASAALASAAPASGVLASAAGASGVLASAALASGASPSASARLARSASAIWAICTGSALNVAAAPASDAFMAPASLASSTSRGSRSASLVISDGLIALPSSTPPLITSSGFALAKSRRPLAASTTSPSTNAIADGPTSIEDSCSSSPASLTAILVRVFLTTANVAWLPSDRR